MVGYALLFLLVIMILAVLILPMELEIDTENEVFRFRWRGIGGIRVLPEVGKWRVNWWLLGWSRDINFGARRAKNEPEKSGVVNVKRRGKPARIVPLLRNLSKAVEAKRLIVDIDTGDFVRNARLYPAFLVMSRGHRRLSINFQDRQMVSILLQTRLYRLAGAALRTYISS